MNLDLHKYQDSFLFSQARFPALISAIGTGKTLCLLLKIKLFCENYPDTLALIIRKEYTDLRDSTISDFENYFQVSINHSDKSFTFPNGSKILFRHGAELNVLKNLNLSIVGIEQAEEFEDESTFDFLRDRLRRKNSPLRQLCIIANARGHNWIWQRWIQGCDKIDTYDSRCGVREYYKENYHCCTANSFANEENLPADFIADLKTMEVEAPNHYAQYILNSFEELEEDDLVFTFRELEDSRQLEYAHRQGYGLRLMGFDISRYGNDKCAAVGLTQLGALAWVINHVEVWDKRDLDYTQGRILSTAMAFKADYGIIDEDGIGSGPLDNIVKGHEKEYFRGFKNVSVPFDANRDFANTRTINCFKLKEMIQKGWISIKDEGLIQELMTLRYRYTNDGRRQLVPKEVMKKKGFKSPNMADAAIYAVSLINVVTMKQAVQYIPRPSQSDDLFQIAGIR